MSETPQTEPRTEQAPTKEKPFKYDIYDDVTPISKVTLDGEHQTRGLVESYYINENGSRVETVTLLNGTYGTVEVVDGAFSRSLVGPFVQGETVSVKRSNGGIEAGWTVGSSGIDKATGIHKTAVYKPAPEGGFHTKNVVTERLRELNTPEAEKIEVEEDLGEVAVSEVVTPIDEVSAAQRLMGEAPSDVAPPEVAAESKYDMYTRFIRERQQDLHQLYAQHRRLPLDSASAAVLVTQIEAAKEDIGHYLKEQRKLR